MLVITYVGVDDICVGLNDLFVGCIVVYDMYVGVDDMHVCRHG